MTVASLARVRPPATPERRPAPTVAVAVAALSPVTVVAPPVASRVVAAAVTFSGPAVPSTVTVPPGATTLVVTPAAVDCTATVAGTEAESVREATPP